MKRFIPKENQIYWYLDGEINCPEFIGVSSSRWIIDVDDDCCDYNVFKSKREASIALKKILKILNNE